MKTETSVRGKIMGGVLDPAYEHSYYTLIPCPRHGDDVTLADHQSCEHFGGLRLDPETGAYFVYCLRDA
jgi:hypothetical protein